MIQTKRDTPVLRGRGLSVWLATTHYQNLYCWEGSRNRRAGQNPPRVVAPLEEEEEGGVLLGSQKGLCSMELDGWLVGWLVRQSVSLSVHTGMEISQCQMNTKESEMTRNQQQKSCWWGKRIRQVFLFPVVCMWIISTWDVSEAVWFQAAFNALWTNSFKIMRSISSIHC